MHGQFSAPQIEYSLGGSNKNDSHVYFMLQVFRVILLLSNCTIVCQIILLFDFKCCYDATLW